MTELRINVFGISSEDVGNRLRVKPELSCLLRGLDNSMDDSQSSFENVLAALYTGDLVSPKGEGFDDVEIIAAEGVPYYVGFDVVPPWQMKVHTRQDAVAQLQAFVDYFFDGADADFASRLSDYYSYALIDD